MQLLSILILMLLRPLKLNAAHYHYFRTCKKMSTLNSSFCVCIKGIQPYRPLNLTGYLVNNKALLLPDIMIMIAFQADNLKLLHLHLYLSFKRSHIAI